MQKILAALILAAAAATPAAASEFIPGSSPYPMHSDYVASNGMGAYAFASRGDRQRAQDANIRLQSQIQWQVSDR